MRIERFLGKYEILYRFPGSGGAVFAATSLALPGASQADVGMRLPQPLPPELFQPQHRDWCARLSLAPDRLALMKQVHGRRVKYVETPGDHGEGDAMITDRPGLFLGVRTADCAAVFVAVPPVPGVGIAHAGWRGARWGIVLEMLRTMQKRWRLAANQFWVALSPLLQPCCYQVGPEFRNYFPDRFLEAREGKLWFFLANTIKEQCLSLGIPEEQIDVSPECTSCSALPLYSHRAQRTTGRHLNIIGILPEGRSADAGNANPYTGINR